MNKLISLVVVVALLVFGVLVYNMASTADVPGVTVDAGVDSGTMVEVVITVGGDSSADAGAE